ncbi:MAG: DNA gyrase inhibitor YacG [Gammaproteobacteria bacterium]|nr:DNA gyrase inhibitor YacG [Gammaproteobacteria bacterium]
MTLKVNCPNCGTTVPWQPDSLFRPFCSRRCQLIDLGEWAMENHKIPGQAVDPLAASDDAMLNDPQQKEA